MVSHPYKRSLMDAKVADETYPAKKGAKKKLKEEKKKTTKEHAKEKII